MNDANEGLKAVETYDQVQNILNQVSVYHLRQALKFGPPAESSED